MPKRFQTAKIILLVVTALSAWSFPSQGKDAVGKGDIVVIPLRGEIAPPLFLFLRRAVKVAESNGASAIILDMDTYGGRLDAAEKMTGVLNRTKLPNYTYINTNAGSAGALVALATDRIYMAPVSTIGAAAPMLSSGEDLPETAKEKTISYWSAFIRGLAEKNGHNPDVGEAFMNKDREVKVGDQIIHPKGTLLSLSAQEAAKIYGGKPLLAAGVAESAQEVARQSALQGELVTLEPSGFERIAFWITSLAPILLFAGLVLAYLEFKIPGVGLPGLLAGICFTLFFLGHYLAGLAGWEVAALFALGVIFILIEIFFFAHSSVIFGIAGVLLILGSFIWAMVDRYPSQPLWPTGGMLAVPLRNLFITMILSMVAIYILAKYLPKTAFYRMFALNTVIPSGTSLSPGHSEFQTGADLRRGAQGIALTSLRPSGKAQFGEHVIDVVTEGDFIAATTPVSITQRDGMRIVVKQVETAPDAV